MKLLLDQNLSHRVVPRIEKRFPGSKHVRDFRLSSADDAHIWSHAAKGGFTIVSKDVDFQQRALVFAVPPKVIWLRTGNCTSATIVEMILRNSDAIEAFEIDEAATLLSLEA